MYELFWAVFLAVFESGITILGFAIAAYGLQRIAGWRYQKAVESVYIIANLVAIVMGFYLLTLGITSMIDIEIPSIKTLQISGQLTIVVLAAIWAFKPRLLSQ